MANSLKTLNSNIAYSDTYHQLVEGCNIPFMLLEILKNKKIKSIVDLGCGDGIFLSEIISNFPDKKLTGVDISQRRIMDLKNKFKNVNFYCRDVVDTKLKSKYDLVICSQVIEHVDNPPELISEARRLLKKGGLMFISSVVKRPYAVYKYWNRGFVLDPTHVSEFVSFDQFLNLLKKIDLVY